MKEKYFKEVIDTQTTDPFLYGISESHLPLNLYLYFFFSENKENIFSLKWQALEIQKK